MKRKNLLAILGGASLAVVGLSTFAINNAYQQNNFPFSDSGYTQCNLNEGKQAEFYDRAKFGIGGKNGQ